MPPLIVTQYHLCVCAAGEDGAGQSKGGCPRTMDRAHAAAPALAAEHIVRRDTRCGLRTGNRCLYS